MDQAMEVESLGSHLRGEDLGDFHLDIDVGRARRPTSSEFHGNGKPSRSIRLVHNGLAGRLQRLSFSRRIRVFQVLVLFTDLIILGVAAAASTLLAGQTAHFLQLALLPPVVCACSFGGFGLYRVEGARGPEEMRLVLSAIFIGMLLVALTIRSEPPVDTSWFISLFLLMSVAAGLSRTAVRQLHRHLMRLGVLVRTAAVVGTDEESIALAHRLMRQESGYAPLGHIALGRPAASGRRLPIIGEIDRLAEITNRGSIDCLFLGERLTASQQSQVLRATRLTGTEIRMPTALSVLESRLSVRTLGEDTCLAVVPLPFTRTKALAKRATDLTGAALGLMLFLPLLVVVCAAIKLSSPGPVFFKQERITKNARPFRMLKFRTMYQDAEHLLTHHQIDHTAAFFKLDEDPRITKVGQVLRRLSLDELPQLWNVLRGDMSLVGPRPLPAEQVKANTALLAPRHEVRAGLTGWWQINGRSDVAPEQAVALDLYYIENWSLSLDFYILLRTARVVLSRAGAR